MNPILRNVFAIVVGWLVGSLINMGIVQLGHFLLPIENLEPNDMESYAAIIPTLSAEYFLFPFLAHALGTLLGAFLATKIASTHKFRFALAIGIIFLVGGITAASMFGGPIWFIILDLVVAYIPMAFLGYKLGR